MAKEKLSKLCSIRISERDYTYLTQLSDELSINQGVCAAARILSSMEGQALYELRGVFEPGEWKYMAEMLRGIPLSEERKVQITELNRLLADPRGLIHLKTKYGIDPYAITSKLHRLTGIHSFAITRRIEHFYQSAGDNPPIEDFNAWAQY